MPDRCIRVQQPEFPILVSEMWSHPEAQGHALWLCCPAGRNPIPGGVGFRNGVQVTLEVTFAGQVDGAAGTFVPLPVEAEMVREESHQQLACVGAKCKASRLQELEYLWTKPAVPGVKHKCLKQ